MPVVHSSPALLVLPFENEMAIMADYSQSLTPPEAVRRLRVLDEEELTWVEEPVLAHDYERHALVARASTRN